MLRAALVESCACANHEATASPAGPAAAVSRIPGAPDAAEPGVTATAATAAATAADTAAATAAATATDTATDTAAATAADTTAATAAATELSAVHHPGDAPAAVSATDSEQRHVSCDAESADVPTGPCSQAPSTALAASAGRLPALTRLAAHVVQVHC